MQQSRFKLRLNKMALQELGILVSIYFVTCMAFPGMFVGGLYNDHPHLPKWQENPLAQKNNGTKLDVDSNHIEDEYPDENLGHHRPKRSLRVKRATGTTMNDVVFTMEETASQSLGGGQADIGDSFTYKVVVDLPHISSATDITMEIFAIDPTTGVGGFSMCGVNQKSVGTGVLPANVEPSITETIKNGYPSVVEKATLLWSGVTTSGEDGGDNNKLEVEFQAMMLPVPEVTAGAKFYISAGIEYADEAYVWVGQFEVTATLSGDLFNAAVTVNAEPSGPPDQLSIGQSVALTFDAIVTHPMADIKFVAAQPLGYTDIFHIGPISYTVGDAFACSNPNLWETSATTSSTGASNSKYTVEYPGLMNREAARDVSDTTNNKISFTVPVTVMNSQTVAEGLERDLSFGLYIGTSKLWTALHTITITGTATPATGNSPSSVTATMLNTGTIVQGDGVVYKLEVVVPAGPGWCSLDVEIEGGTGFDAANVHVVSTGAVGYVPPNWAVEEPDGAKLMFNYGDVENPSASTTTVVIEVAFNTDPDLTAGQYTPATIKVGGTDAASIPAFDVVDNPDTALIDVVVDEFGIDAKMSNELYVGGQVALDLLVTVPTGAGRKHLQLEAVPDFDVTAFSMRVCGLDVYDIGKNLACIKSSNESEITYNKTETTREYDDYGIFPIGPTCPIDRIGDQDSDNQFKANIVFELPPSASIVADTEVKLSGGLKIDENTIWVSSGTYTAKDTVFSGAVVTSHADGTIKPFFTSYPYVSNKDRTGGDAAYKVGETFFKKYVIKPQPLSTGKYTVTVAPGAQLKVCRLIVTHIGKNFPCTRMPTDEATGTETTVWGFSGVDYAADTDVSLTFTTLTNWGRDKLSTDLTPDEDSIQFVVFFNVIPGTTATTDYEIGWTVDYGDASFTGSDKVNFDAALMADSTGKEITLHEYKSLIGPDDQIHKGISKLLQFAFVIPPNFYGPISFNIENENFALDTKQVDFCRIAMVAAGNNVPCVQAWDNTTTNFEVLNNSMSLSPAVEVKLVEDEVVYPGMKILVEQVCQAPYSSVAEDNLLTFEVALRVKDSATDDEIINLKASITGASATWSQTIPLTVKAFDSSLVTPVDVDPNTVKVTIPEATKYGVDIPVGQKEWLTFYVTMPVDITTAVEVSFLTPSFETRPILHATDIKFAECEGKNVLCMDEHVDLQRNFATTWGQTGNVTTFMSMDTATSNLGYVTNTGFTKKWGGYVVDDDVFAVKVEVQMSDHPLTLNDQVFDVYFAVKIGDTIVVASQTVNATRDDTVLPDRVEYGRGNIIVDANQTLDVSTIYNATDPISFETIIYHGENSRAEGYPARIRIIAPSYVHWTSDNSFVHNYTQGDVSVDTVVLHNSTDLSIIDFEFTGGILFPDIISFNFSLSVDPYKERPIGSGEATSAIVFHPICQQSKFRDWPATHNETWVGCGSMEAEPFKSLAAECYDTITISSTCQVAASSQLDVDSIPFNALSTTSVWSPALRTGKAWREYLLFDFLTVARINKIKIAKTESLNGNSYRPPEEITFEVSNTPTHFNHVIKTGIPPDGVIDLGGAVEARYAKLTVKAEYTTPEAAPIAINGLEFLGCMAQDIPSNAECDPVITGNTIMADDPKRYRHFAVDTTSTPVAKRIVYFCDLNPYRDGMFCYCSDRLAGGNTWSELPRFVGHIVGFSEKKGRIYFKDREDRAILSSYNCKDVELADALPDDIVAAKNVPGVRSQDVTDVTWDADTEIKGNFEGISDGANLLVKWKTCCDT